MDEENKELKKPIYKKWWFWLLVALGVFAIIGMLTNTEDSNDNNRNTNDPNSSEKYVDTSNFDSDEIKAYLEEKGYKFETKHTPEKVVTKCHNIISRYIGDDSIYIQRFDIIGLYESVDFSTSFHDSRINDKYAEIINTSENDTDLLKAQYNGYKKWLNTVNITETQLLDLLEHLEQNYCTSKSSDNGSTDNNTNSNNNNSSNNTDTPTVSRYEQILNEYTAKLKRECPNISMMECAEISTEGITKMAEYMLTAKGTDGQYATYEKWAGKLTDVYLKEAR